MVFVEIVTINVVVRQLLHSLIDFVFFSIDCMRNEGRLGSDLSGNCRYKDSCQRISITLEKTVTWSFKKIESLEMG